MMASFEFNMFAVLAGIIGGILISLFVSDFIELYKMKHPYSNKNKKKGFN